jgi:hypothetical protein
VRGNLVGWILDTVVVRPFEVMQAHPVNSESQNPNAKPIADARCLNAKTASFRHSNSVLDAKFGVCVLILFRISLGASDPRQLSP